MKVVKLKVMYLSGCQFLAQVSEVKLTWFGCKKMLAGDLGTADGFSVVCADSAGL